MLEFIQNYLTEGNFKLHPTQLIPLTTKEWNAQNGRESYQASENGISTNAVEEQIKNNHALVMDTKSSSVFAVDDVGGFETSDPIDTNKQIDISKLRILTPNQVRNFNEIHPFYNSSRFPSVQDLIQVLKTEGQEPYLFLHQPTKRILRLRKVGRLTSSG